MTIKQSRFVVKHFDGVMIDRQQPGWERGQGALQWSCCWV